MSSSSDNESSDSDSPFEVEASQEELKLRNNLQLAYQKQVTDEQKLIAKNRRKRLVSGKQIQSKKKKITNFSMSLLDEIDVKEKEEEEEIIKKNQQLKHILANNRPEKKKLNKIIQIDQQTKLIIEKQVNNNKNKRKFELLNSYQNNSAVENVLNTLKNKHQRVSILSKINKKKHSNRNTFTR